MKRFVVLFFAAAVCLAAARPAPAGARVSFGVLPVVQALPLFVAADEGFFAREGLDVELVSFRSGLEKDAAVAAGRIQGYFGDMLTSIILCANQVPARMVATVFNTTGDQRMFAVLAAPGTGRPPLEELAEKGIAGSSNTIIEYVVTSLLERSSPGAVLNMVETKDIMTRIPMLLSGQVAGAALPEPLVTFVESKGAEVVADDSGLGISPTVLTFTAAFIDSEPDTVRSFLRAVSGAVAFIGENPEAARSVMIKHTRVPEPLRETYPVPHFDPPSPPDRELVLDAYGWLKKKGVLKRDLALGEMVTRLSVER